MALRTLDELTDHIAVVVRDTGIEALIERALNLTLAEIWTFHPWSFKRRKQTFATVTSQEDYNLDEEVDEIVVLRDRTNNRKLLYLPDRLFYELNPNPEDDATAPPRYYRLWEETGFSTNLAAADTIYVSSSSASDTSSFSVRVVGRNSSGEVVSETLTLNGTTSVTSSTTWAASGLMQISKSGQTTGTVTCYRTTGATVLSEIAPEESAPRFKRLSLYPIPNAAITLYLEYHERLRFLTNDADVPQMDTKWNWVLVEGTLAKIWGYKQNTNEHQLSLARYQQGLLLMRQQDDRNLDYVPVMRPRQLAFSTVRLNADANGTDFPSYSLDY